MKQFAIAFAAILATSAFAQDEAEQERPFIMSLAYDSADDLYLGLEVANPVKLQLPGCGRRSGNAECTGWQLVGDYSGADFTVALVEETVGRKTIRAFAFEGIQASESGLDVQFENDCKQDDTGSNVTATVHVFVNDLI